MRSNPPAKLYSPAAAAGRKFDAGAAARLGAGRSRTSAGPRRSGVEISLRNTKDCGVPAAIRVP